MRIISKGITFVIHLDEVFSLMSTSSLRIGSPLEMLLAPDRHATLACCRVNISRFKPRDKLHPPD